MQKYICYKFWDEIAYAFPNSNCATGYFAIFIDESKIIKDNKDSILR